MLIVNIEKSNRKIWENSKNTTKQDEEKQQILTCNINIKSELLTGLINRQITAKKTTLSENRAQNEQQKIHHVTIYIS